MKRIKYISINLILLLILSNCITNFELTPQDINFDVQKQEKYISFQELSASSDSFYVIIQINTNNPVNFIEFLNGYIKIGETIIDFCNIDTYITGIDMGGLVIVKWTNNFSDNELKHYILSREDPSLIDQRQYASYPFLYKYNYCFSFRGNIERNIKQKLIKEKTKTAIINFEYNLMQNENVILNDKINSEFNFKIKKIPIFCMIFYIH